MDRQTTITLPDNGVVTNEYFNTGELKKTSGARTYTVEYTYDYAGRLKTMLAGTGTTTWNYDANRGFLTSKIYADSNGTSYSNNVSGKIVSRTWARGITTDYSYNNAGEITAINYSDDTPDVTYTLDRRGRRTSVTWGTNTVSLSYNAAGQLTNENWSAGIIRDIRHSRHLRPKIRHLRSARAGRISPAYAAERGDAADELREREVGEAGQGREDHSVPDRARAVRGNANRRVPTETSGVSQEPALPPTSNPARRVPRCNRRHLEIPF